MPEMMVAFIDLARWLWGRRRVAWLWGREGPEYLDLVGSTSREAGYTVRWEQNLSAHDQVATERAGDRCPGGPVEERLIIQLP